VKRVDVAHEQVHVVFRVDHLPIAPSSEKKSLQDCRGSNLARPRKCVSALVVTDSVDDLK
jgi:hypothetical protein